MLAGEQTSGPAADIVLRVRLPRVLLAMGVGASLAVAGALFQALLRNPLADPFVLGVSGGAALGGTLVLSLGAGLGLGYAAVAPAAFAGAVLATLLLYGVAGTRGRLSATNLLLTGVVFNAFASAAIVFLASLAGLTETTSIFLWLIGSLEGARPAVAGWVALFLMLGLLAALPLARGLNLLALGDEAAQQLGVDVERAEEAGALRDVADGGGGRLGGGADRLRGPHHPAPAAPAAGARPPAADPRGRARQARPFWCSATRWRAACSAAVTCRWGRSRRSPAGRSFCGCCAATTCGPLRHDGPAGGARLRGDLGPDRRSRDPARRLRSRCGPERS